MKREADVKYILKGCAMGMFLSLIGINVLMNPFKFIFCLSALIIITEIKTLDF